MERKKKTTPPAVSRSNLVAWMQANGASPEMHDKPYSILDRDVVSDRMLDRPMTPPPIDDPFVYLCPNNAHVFLTIDTKKLPDEIGINNLQVRPNVTTPTCGRQHVRVAVHCDVCKHAVSEIYSQCEVQACQFALCFRCGEYWRQGRVVGNY
jgi:hypothetical protein